MQMDKHNHRFWSPSAVHTTVLPFIFFSHFDPLRCLFFQQFYIPYETLPRNCRSHATLCTTTFKEYHKLAQAIIERQVGGPGAQLSEGTSASEALV